ncbi:MAG: glycosyltransferase family 2 protein [Deltaproteobacteria bacterium]|nr:glycosyltransferase family 2 protein [Deltaproteobacteria bacterium]MCL5277918.1 glycosyltransferase family 2 protein [Deltaproteobacteria bacterium]
MPGLSVVIVTHNEEDRIRGCLDSVAWADEIIVVDAFSTDRTAEYCRPYTDRIYTRVWDGFIPQKNYALKLATKEWVLSLDADERLSDRLIPQIKAAIGTADRGCAAYSMPRKTYYLGRWMEHSGWYPDRKTRLIRNGAGVWTGQEPHDTLEVDGRVCRLDGDILHYSFRDLSHHIQKLDYFTDLASSELIKSGRHAGPVDMMIHSSGMFVKMFFVKKGFLDGVQGFIAACVSAFHVFIKYAKAWEKGTEQ